MFFFLLHSISTAVTNFSCSPTSAFVKVAYWLATPWQKWRSSGFRKLELRLGESNPGVRPESQVHTTPLAGVWLFAIKSVLQTATGQQHECDFPPPRQSAASFSLAARKEGVCGRVLDGRALQRFLRCSCEAVWASLCTSYTCVSSADQRQYKKPGLSIISVPDGCCDEWVDAAAPPPAASPFTSVSSCLLLFYASHCFFLLISFPFCFPLLACKKIYTAQTLQTVIAALNWSLSQFLFISFSISLSF